MDLTSPILKIATKYGLKPYHYISPERSDRQFNKYKDIWTISSEAPRVSSTMENVQRLWGSAQYTSSEVEAGDSL